jgi:hypothetical protein
MTHAPFTPGEVGSAGRALVPVARLLEEYAESSPAPSADLADRILSAVARQRPPTPPVLLLRSLRDGSLAAAAGYLAASLQAAIGARRSFPLAVRAQAIAVVLTAVIILGGGGVALAAGAAGVLQVIVPALAPRAAPAVEHSRPIAPGHSHVRQAPRRTPHSHKEDKRGSGATDHPGHGGGLGNGIGAGNNATGGSDDDSANGTERDSSGKKEKRSDVRTDQS